MYVVVPDVILVFNNRNKEKCVLALEQHKITEVVSAPIPRSKVKSVMQAIYFLAQINLIKKKHLTYLNNLFIKVFLQSTYR